MTDNYTKIANSPIGRLVVPRVGLPQPVELERYEPGAPVVDGLVLLGAAPGGRLAEPVAKVLAGAGAEVTQTDPGDDQRVKALVFDATGISESASLGELRDFFSPTARRVERCGRIVVLGTPPGSCSGAREATAQRALEGFTRSLAKEARAGTTAQLVYVAPGAEGRLDSTLRFLLSPRSAYVSGQVVRIGDGADPPDVDPERPLAGRVALVTGAARGIGAAIAEVLDRDGAEVVGVDLDDAHLKMDITAAGAPKAIVSHLREEHGGVDVVVHNAGITRDKTIGRMTEEQWAQVVDINLSSEERINDALLEAGLLREHGRIVCVSSISGIAGNAGQTNYATSKTGVIGMVEALAPAVAEHGATINAVAPGFIETQMTAKVPIALREAGRRMNSLSQGGLPVDVAETIAWFAHPGSSGINGNVVRVCGQSLLGA